MDLWEIERQLLSSAPICGVDEAGAGPLAGRVYAAAVILPFEMPLAGLNDSKKLSAKKRETLFDEILSIAESYAVAWATVEEIEEINILNARMLAMSRAVEALSRSPGVVLVDGNRTPTLEIPCRAVVGGDGKSASIAAASILAKVSRDRHMLELAKQYPLYGFERHKGYGTALHFARLREHGISPVHRRSFLKNV